MILYERRNGYLFLEYSEKYEYKKIIELAKGLDTICREEHYEKVLVKVIGVVEEIGVLDKFDLAVEVSRIIRSPKSLAVLLQENSIDRFSENVAVNRGLNVHLFSRMEDALKWLSVENNK